MPFLIAHIQLLFFVRALAKIIVMSLEVPLKTKKIIPHPTTTSLTIGLAIALLSLQPYLIQEHNDRQIKITIFPDNRCHFK